ncbi:ImmA/IrrE family metallo-endopeptidase [bacterium]|nr:ImmA/IrrE family metallo-endopeptidase [bacterium]
MCLKFYKEEEFEDIADEINSTYDKERLSKPKPINVYDLAESINASISRCRLIANPIILGATIFSDCELDVIVKDEITNDISLERRIYRSRTIILNDSLGCRQTKEEELSENFTMAHECFHLIEHKYYYDSISQTLHKDVQKNFSLKQKNNLEWQANYGAACILMPRRVVFSEVKALQKGVLTKDTIERNHAIEKMAERFGVNFSPMKYRLINLGLIPSEKEKEQCKNY